ncbi:asparagine synthase [Bacillus sp. FJAT-18017]|uniref:asparagine synthase (glutamine-hydrolyzing) n=1 Tax=Bacillus sp. FJAT-18017 TaxID=1705566 RepID=UPI0006ADA267|nr:asparagine synthase (glutamine-hydrolyzing) [Bacillus sp. FJAT-18017]ALC91899.1 asparagine synthase [Bacillus sp. FJAT-18017]
MCGIAGWVDFRRDMEKEKIILEKMTDTLSKRGPDDTNIWTDRHAGFGHKRLAVVDLVGGRQPMTKKGAGGTYTICYNGELYNTEDLRRELLLKGYSFSGHSDTEVLLASYMEWKEECVDRLNGIFAFGVWDSAAEKLFFARDRLGVKPAFYSEKQGFIFGSELKALLAHPEMKAELDREGLAELFGMAPSRTPGAGVFKGIKELRPGHALTYSRNGLKLWRYWNVKSQTHSESLDETAEKVSFLVDDAVKRQLVSDVPLCTFLSGGLDSSIITAIAANEYQGTNLAPLRTFSIDYEDNQYFFASNEFQPDSDEFWINLMSSSFQTQHVKSIISQKQLAEELKEAMEVRDLPGMADIDSSLLWFCREIKKEYTVSLSGECADEIFGGYPWFHRKADFEREGFPWMRSTEMRLSLLKEGWRKKLKINDYLMERYLDTVKETPALEGESKEDARRRQLFYLNMVWFMTALLDRKDRMSMGASLEVRVPFADHRLVEYVWNIPWEMKMHGNREKGILRKAMDGILPADVLYRKKSPYPKTHHPAYTEAVQKLANEALSDRSSALYEFFDKKQLKDLVESGGNSFTEPFFGQLMAGPQLLAHFVQMHSWFKKYNVNVVEC